jgi:hypothetical protein
MKKMHWLVFVVIFLSAVAVRLLAYDKLTFSTGTQDTASYLRAAKIAFPSWRFFTSERAATLPLLYKIFQPEGGYRDYPISDPARTGPVNLRYQSEFIPIVVIQTLLSILGWGSLALVLFYRLSNPGVKAVSAILVFLFAFSPQLADWDQVLVSESLSFSLYAILTALGIELAFHLSQGESHRSWRTRALMTLFALVMAVWVFTRDSNVYLLLVSLVFLLAFLLLAYRRNFLSPWPVVLLIVLLFGFFAFHQVTFRISQRWLLPLLNNMTAYVFRYPARVAFFEARGMPVTPEILAIRGQSGRSGIYAQVAFMEWAEQYGLSAYTQFLLANPRWVLLMVYNDLEYVFNENLQPYYRERTVEDVHPRLKAYLQRPEWLAPLGHFLHPTWSGTILADGLLVLILLALALHLRTSQAITWAWLGAWLFLGGLAVLVVAYLAEVRGVVRHTLGGVMPLRLGLWLLLAMVADLGLLPKTK